MKILTKVASAAILAACTIAPATASIERVSARVRVGDLDLTTVNGRAALGARVEKAAMLACGDYSGVGDHRARQRCHAEMLADARAQVSRRQMRATELASLSIN